MAARKPTKEAKAKKTAPARKMTAVKKPMTKSAIINEIAQNAELTKNQVSSVFDELAFLIERLVDLHLAAEGLGKLEIVGILDVIDEMTGVQKMGAVLRDVGILCHLVSPVRVSRFVFHPVPSTDRQPTPSRATAQSERHQLNTKQSLLRSAEVFAV